MASSAQQKLDKRKYSFDNIDSKHEKYKENSQRTRLIKSGSLDDPTVGREEKDLPSDLLFKRSGSLKGRTRKDSASSEHRRHRSERDSHKNSPKNSPSKQKEFKFKEVGKHVEEDMSSTNLNSTGSVYLSAQKIIVFHDTTVDESNSN